MTNDKLYVNVGAGVIVRKSAKEVIEIIDSQNNRLSEAKEHLLKKAEVLGKSLQQCLQHMQEEESLAKNEKQKKN